MNFKELENYILKNKHVTFDYPFDEKTRVYRISDKMFALTEDTTPLRVNLKCNPIYALELRSLYEGIIGGYHMSKKHWNTVYIDEDSDVDEETIKELIDHSFELVYGKLTKKQKALLLESSVKGSVISSENLSDTMVTNKVTKKVTMKLNK